MPVGVSGHLHIGGVGVARGYLGLPALTAERFIDSPFVPGERLYRSGDLARYRADGELEFLGRNDFQVKLRGVRVELGEIEARLEAFPGVRRAVVLMVGDSAQHQRLVACCSFAATRPEEAAAHEHLALTLPAQVLPSAYLWLEALPLTANGKIDRDALRAMADHDLANRQVNLSSPRDHIELALYQIWKGLLLASQIGIRDNFFNVGGTSIAAIKMAHQVREVFGIELPIRVVIGHPTIEALGGWIRSGAGPTTAQGSLIEFRRGAGQRNVVCIHPAGGTAFCYLSLAKVLDESVGVYGVQSPGLNPGETTEPTVEAMAIAYMRLIEPLLAQPLILTGLSFGGLVAYEMARRLTAAGYRQVTVVLLDTQGSDNSAYRQQMAPVDMAEFRDKLVRFNGMYPGIDDAQVERYFQIYNHNRMAVADYVCAPKAGRVVLIQAREGFNRAQLHGLRSFWRRRAGDGYLARLVNGGHWDMLETVELQRVARTLEQELRRFDIVVTSPADSLPATLLGRFAEQVRTRPLALAVIDRQAPFSSTLSYAELAAASERIAHALLARGVAPGQSLALCMPRSWRWLAAIIGALKVGAVVVPLGPCQPKRAPDADIGRQRLRRPAGGQSTRATVEPFVAGRCLDAAGARGRDPAGLARRAGCGEFPVLHLGFDRYSRGATSISVPAIDSPAWPTRPSMPSVSSSGRRCSTVWAPLLNGGTCVIVADDDLLDARQLAHVLEAQRVDNLFMTVSLFNTLARQYPRCFASLRQVLIGGEQISAVAVRDWYRANPDSACRIFNVYGPTECTTFALCQPIARHFSGSSVPIGRPLPDTGVRILDEQQRPVTPGTVGELYLSGSGVAQGYRQRPEETARCFLVLPDAAGQLQRHYRTGDRVRENESGLIEYVGRADRQVKVRGFRIEPGEVEQRIIEHPGVAQAYVCTRRQAAEDHQLLAFIVPRGPLEHADFDAYLQAQLPGYMRPHHLFLLEHLPLTANGKVDRERLLEEARQPWRAPRPDDLAAGNEEGAELSWLLAQVRTLLGQPQLGAGDDWLGSGGDSLKALRLRSAIRQRWQVELSMQQLLGEPFAGLAAKLSEPQGSSAAWHRRRVAPGVCPLLPSNADCGCCSSVSRIRRRTTCR